MAFQLPSSLNAVMPPERRGIRRDRVRMMVLDRQSGATRHDEFYHIDRYLKRGDLIVLNNSRTVPARLTADLLRMNSLIASAAEVRLARRRSESVWEVWIVTEKAKIGDKLYFSESLYGTIIEEKENSPIHIVEFSKTGIELYFEIYSLGEPVRYEYIDHPWALDYYQTVFASIPGSVEMPSAGRAFSWELLFKLQKKGIKIAYLQLHTGLSYLLDDEMESRPEDNYEEYNIPAETMEAILKTRASGGRVIAAGTTVVRAVESAVCRTASAGVTNLYIDSSHKLALVDGIITGLHEPEASHLDMLSAFVPEDKLLKAYQVAIEQCYLWHEFGDVNLIV
ncbi:S-adenosylmethionine:tRNA ribosyltransferase-isomerase [Bacillus sp. M6-12]|nr:S-adenosylmethionine:tRNA ribosyltransferase-isomerase [Bacillus sp. M6-12]